tara:strand:- start:219 stop:920 length:702 start_codon:yes stop_codon:yes gene_type:complete
MYNNKKISLILPAYNEEENIKNCILNFEKLNIIDEIIVVDNNSNDNTEMEIKETKAIYLKETTQGYGISIRSGLKKSTGDLLITCEPDGTFEEKDIFKLLQYSDDFECVFGTRTAKSAIRYKAKMQFYLRIGNIMVAKLLTYLFNGPTLTDVGCTYKLISKNAYKNIEQKLKIIKSDFQPEMMIRLIKAKHTIIEIPVNYLERKGKSKITYNFTSSLALALKMVVLIIKLRIV